MTTMTRTRGYIFTVAAAAIYIGLGVIFSDGLFDLGNFWSNEYLAEGTWLSYLLLALIIVGGVYQANRIPEKGVTVGTGGEGGEGQIHDPVWWKLLLGNTYLAVLWLPLRFYVGQAWLTAGEHKIRDGAWMDGGTALQGYWTGAVTVNEATGKTRITYAWFQDFIQYMLDNSWYTWFAKLVAVGEVLVGLGLLLGALVGIAAFFGTVLNFNFMLAGTVSTNPVLFALTVFLVLGWKVAGWLGLDRYLLPMLGTPWQLGEVAGTRKDAPIIGGRHPNVQAR
jgi:thiosulfate dehydrogenase [quinone] large subunit